MNADGGQVRAELMIAAFWRQVIGNQDGPTRAPRLERSAEPSVAPKNPGRVFENQYDEVRLRAAYSRGLLPRSVALQPVHR